MLRLQLDDKPLISLHPRQSLDNVLGDRERQRVARKRQISSLTAIPRLVSILALRLRVEFVNHPSGRRGAHALVRAVGNDRAGVGENLPLRVVRVHPVLVLFRRPRHQVDCIVYVQHRLPSQKVGNRRGIVALVNRIAEGRARCGVVVRAVQRQNAESPHNRIADDVVDGAVADPELPLGEQGAGLRGCRPCCACGRVCGHCGTAKGHCNAACVHHRRGSKSAVAQLEAPALHIAHVRPRVLDVSPGKQRRIARNRAPHLANHRAQTHIHSLNKTGWGFHPTPQELLSR